MSQIRLTIGLEKELFLHSRKVKGLVPVPKYSGIPHDDGMMQVEFRTNKPSTVVEEAVYDIMLQEEIASNKLDNDLKFITKPFCFNSPLQQDELMRVIGGKGPRAFHNYLGHLNYPVLEECPTGHTQHYAGIHISFTHLKTITTHSTRNYAKKNKLSTHETSTVSYNQMFDYLPLFKELDRLFEKEIKASGRLPGFYEFKYDGRVEYRSLPNNIKPKVLITKIKQALKNCGFDN